MKYFFVSVIILFLTACSIKNYEHTETKILTLKTPKIKFSDIAYLRHNDDDELELELFIAGHVFKKITIDHLICVSDEGCMSKNSFNAQYLTKAYPQNILQNILLGRKIFEGKNLKKSSSGFTQLISTQDVDIKYIVKQEVVYFKDRKNHILLRIKDTE